MDFVANGEPQIKEMLATLGIAEVDELFSSIPKELRTTTPTIDDGLSEQEGAARIRHFAAKNSSHAMESYLGAGCYDHYIPAVVRALCSRGEFLTSYTPYQAEASQGTLQAIFEFQSAICALTGLEVANASVYDGASACAEALLMALRHNKGRRKLLVASSLHPHYRAVIDTYLNALDINLITIPYLQDGILDQEALLGCLDNTAAALLLPYPNFFGAIDALSHYFSAAKAVGAIPIVAANPLAFALFADAADLGAEIAVGDCQPLGLPMHFGGPFAGYMACTEALVRQLPGRIVGETVDAHGRRGFVLTLQAREQHIRREKATSNICTNQNLCVLSSLITLLWYGKEGLLRLAKTNYQRARYLREGLASLASCQPLCQKEHFNEFAVRFRPPLEQVLERFRAVGIEPGIPLGRFYPDLNDALLVSVTELKTQEMLDRYLAVARDL